MLSLWHHRPALLIQSKAADGVWISDGSSWRTRRSPAGFQLYSFFHTIASSQAATALWHWQDSLTGLKSCRALREWERREGHLSERTNKDESKQQLPFAGSNCRHFAVELRWNVGRRNLLSPELTPSSLSCLFPLWCHTALTPLSTPPAKCLPPMCG